MRKKTIISLAVVASIVFVFLIWQARSITSHSALIKVRIAPKNLHGEAYTKQRQTQVDRILPKLTSILNETGLADVTDANVPFSTVHFGNNNADSVLRFKGESTGKDNTIPMEALIVFDSEEYETLSVTLSEGYSKEPSIRLSELYAELDKALDSTENDKYFSRLW
jgi:hypothetical protein